MSDTKKCPYCGEEIKAQAKKCRHCGEWLDKAERLNNQSHIPATSKSKNDKVTILKYSVLAIVIILIGGFAYVIASKSDEGKEAAQNTYEIDTNSAASSIVEEPLESIQGMSCKDACYHNVEWRLKCSCGAHATVMELEVSKKGENDFFPTNCYYDTYGDFSGITKDCASSLYSRFGFTEDGDYTPTFPLTPDDFDTNAVVQSKSY